MSAVGTMLRNKWTTIGAVIGAVALWWQGIGLKFPETQAEWTSALVALVIAVLGAFAKDATTGSTPAVKNALAWLVLVPLLIACSGPTYVSCKGKGSLNGQGHVSAAYGGSNMFVLSGDCGDGVPYFRGSTPPPSEDDKKLE